VVVAHTVKGKGVRAMEGSPAWHGSVKLTPEQLEAALGDLDTPEAEIRSWLRGEVPA
jgi:transketolase